VDHFRIVCTRQGTLLNEVFDRAYECLGLLAAEIDAQDFASVKGQDSFALSRCYGYVTSCPTGLGSGMCHSRVW
jgi:protein-arginine kinase